eukprot:CAMPEP_0179278218 /NCGR_PEP_ID=MMETSP0797-20121207/35495_1 /TAXON_ID=47934 /ORGANISM="Dinophysis acuminata, Strain DAEP01" /LENGTH=274 /DNA_ID=CAMNT_0020986829 /DNA_START=150 /DNA_END=973 /DNA_ORIENTATION=-
MARTRGHVASSFGVAKLNSSVTASNALSVSPGIVAAALRLPVPPCESPPAPRARASQVTAGLPQRQLAPRVVAGAREPRPTPKVAEARPPLCRVRGHAREAHGEVDVGDALRGAALLVGALAEGEGGDVEHRQRDEVHRGHQEKQGDMVKQVVQPEGQASQLCAQQQHLLHREYRVDVVYHRVAQDRVQRAPCVHQRDYSAHPRPEAPRAAEAELRGSGSGEEHQERSAPVARGGPRAQEAHHAHSTPPETNGHSTKAVGAPTMGWGQGTACLL